MNPILPCRALARPLFAGALALAALAAAPPAPAAPLDNKVWVQDQSDVQPDPAALFGRLANGMRYVIVHNDTPAHQTSLRLRIGSGSFEETLDEQGLAHFLEHMAFKGSTHVAEGEMVKLLERHGLAFGPDTNAQTSFTETVFMLDLPESGAATLDLGMMLMRETASELSLTQAAMNPERGVVLSEERLRDTPDYEALKKELKFMFPGQLAPERMTIGQVDILKTAPVQRLRDFYAANYQPDRAVLVVVGDVDPAAMAAKIKATFASWTARTPERAEPNLGALLARGPASQLIVQPGAHESLSVSWIRPFEATPETEAKDRRLEIEELALTALTRRLERLARTPSPPFIAAAASSQDEVRSGRVTSLFLQPRPGAWREALNAGLKAQAQALRFGLSQAEVDREIAEFRSRFETAAAGSATRRTPDIANEIVRAVDEGEVLTSPEQDLARFERNVRGLTAETATAALRSAFQGQGPILTFVSSKPLEGGDAALAAAFQTAREQTASAVAPSAGALWPYQSFGMPSAVAERREVKDLGVTFVTFANGVRLAVKPTRLRKDQVLVRVRLGDGRLGLPPDRKTESWAADAMIQGGLGKISLEDMEETLASKLYGASLSMSDDAVVLSGATRPADLAIQMQVLAAYVSDPAFRPEAFDRVKASIGLALSTLNATPQGVFAREAAQIEHGGDERWATPSLSDVAAATLPALEHLLKPRLAGSSLEVDMVGDVTVADAIARTQETFAALPTRPAPTPPSPEALRIPRAPTGGPAVRLIHDGRADQAIAYQAWETPGLFVDPQKTRALNVAASVLELRLIDRVRIAEGATYSPQVSSSPSDVFPNFGLVAASVEIPPAKIAGFFTTVQSLSADLRAKGPTPDELERALRPRIATLTKAQQTNEYWATWIAGADTDPRRLEIIRTTLPGYARLTAEDVRIAAQAFSDAAAWRLEITPRALQAELRGPVSVKDR